MRTAAHALSSSQTGRFALISTYAVLLLGFRAGRGAGALGRVFGVLFHELQPRGLRDPAGADRSCPRIPGTLRAERGKVDRGRKTCEKHRLDTNNHPGAVSESAAIIPL